MVEDTHQIHMFQELQEMIDEADRDGDGEVNEALESWNFIVF